MTGSGTITKLYPRGEIEDIVLARIFFQAKGLLDGVLIPEEDKNALLKACMHRLVPILIRCAKITEDIHGKVREEGKSYKPGIGTLAHLLPSVANLEQLTKDFLYQAKSFLRECASIYNIFNDTAFSKASDFYVTKKPSPIIEHAKETYGESNFLYSTLVGYEPEIREISFKRNAAEHPGEHSGDLHINNFRLVEDDGAPILIVPTWQRNDGKEEALVEALRNAQTILMGFAEDLIARSIQNHLVTGLNIVEIPESNRNKDIPIRLTYQMSVI